MPNRILRDYTDSLKFDGITADAERLFVRLLMKADDYGRFHADPRLIKAAAYPLEDRIRPNDLFRWLEELSTRQLILRYEVSGRAYVAIVNFRQRLKQSVPKFPPPEGKDRNWLPEDTDFREPPGTSRNRPELPARDGDGYGDGDAFGRDGAQQCRVAHGRILTAAPPTAEEVAAHAQSQPGWSEAVTREWWLKRESTGWVDGRGIPITSWAADLEAWQHRNARGDAPGQTRTRTQEPRPLSARGRI